jgi:hypothetical protein
VIAMDFASVSTIFLINFENVLTVWYFLGGFHFIATVEIYSS